MTSKETKRVCYFGVEYKLFSFHRNGKWNQLFSTYLIAVQRILNVCLSNPFNSKGAFSWYFYGTFWLQNAAELIPTHYSLVYIALYTLAQVPFVLSIKLLQHGAINLKNRHKLWTNFFFIPKTELLHLTINLKSFFLLKLCPQTTRPLTKYP